MGDATSSSNTAGYSFSVSIRYSNLQYHMGVRGPTCHSVNILIGNSYDLSRSHGKYAFGFCWLTPGILQYLVVTHYVVISSQKA